MCLHVTPQPKGAFLLGKQQSSGFSNLRLFYGYTEISWHFACTYILILYAILRLRCSSFLLKYKSSSRFNEIVVRLIFMSRQICRFRVTIFDIYSVTLLLWLQVIATNRTDSYILLQLWCHGFEQQLCSRFGSRVWLGRARYLVM